MYNKITENVETIKAIDYTIELEDLYDIDIYFFNEFKLKANPFKSKQYLSLIEGELTA